MKDPEFYKLIRARGKCIISNHECFGPLDVEHTKTRGSGGADSLQNCTLMCRWHHVKKGTGVYKMIRDYPIYAKYLVDNDFHMLIEKSKGVTPLKDILKVELSLIAAGYAP